MQSIFGCFFCQFCTFDIPCDTLSRLVGSVGPPCISYFYRSVSNASPHLSFLFYIPLFDFIRFIFPKRIILLLFLNEYGRMNCLAVFSVSNERRGLDVSVSVRASGEARRKKRIYASVCACSLCEENDGPFFLLLFFFFLLPFPSLLPLPPHRGVGGTGMWGRGGRRRRSRYK